MDAAQHDEPLCEEDVVLVIGGTGGTGATVVRRLLAVASPATIRVLRGASKCVTLEMSSLGEAAARADHDWAGQLAALPADDDELPPEGSDVWHLRAPRMVVLGAAAVIGLSIALPLTLL